MNFRKAFFPTSDELKCYDENIKNIKNEKFNYFKNLGFTDSEIIIIDEIEKEEISNTNRFQYYSSRYSLIQSGIINIEKIKLDIDKYLSARK